MNRHNIGIDMVEAKTCSKLYKSFYENLCDYNGHKQSQEQIRKLKVVIQPTLFVDATYLIIY